MRLAYLISQYPAVNHTFMFREVRWLRRHGFEIYSSSIRLPDRPPERLTKEEREEMEATFYVKRTGFLAAMKVHLATLAERPRAYFHGLAFALRLAQWNPKKAVYNLLYFTEALILGRWMMSNRLEHIHIHYASTIGLLLVQVFPVTMSVTFHGPDEFNDPAGFHLAEKIAAALFVCPITNYGRSQLMKVCDHTQWPKLQVALLGIDPNVFEPRPFRRNPSPFQVFCVGRLAPVKGQHVLLGAIEKLVKQGRDVRLRLVGDGPDRRSLEGETVRRGLSGHVIFDGFVNPDQVPILYQEADVLALASFAEGLPGVLLEAMAMEIPCISTWITGVPELIRNEADGLLVAPADEEGLAQAIARLMDEPELRERIGRASRQRILEKFDIARNADCLANYFRGKLGGSAGAAAQ